MEKNLVLLNGEILPLEEACTDVLDRAHIFGDGVFEIVPVYNGRCFALLPHMNNLFDYTIQAKIPAVYTIEELVEFHERLLEATGYQDCEIYTQITRGMGVYNLAFPAQSVPMLTMFAMPADRSGLVEKRAKGVHLILEPDVRWQRCDINSLNRMPEVMAREKAVVGRAFDALFARDGKITEATEGSFFIYKDDILWTYPEGNDIHRNVTRRLLKERLAPDLNLQIMERPFDKEFALKAEEAFVCSPRYEFLPVVKLDRTLINGGKVGMLVPKLQQAFENFVLRECPAVSR